MQINMKDHIFELRKTYEDIVDHRFYLHNVSSSEIKAWKKNSGLNGIRTHDVCDTGAETYQLMVFDAILTGINYSVCMRGNPMVNNFVSKIKILHNLWITKLKY